MPIYEFICQECGHEFEKILSFSAAAPACVNCGAGQVERQMGRPAIHFKGSGWYITDSKKGKKGDKSAAIGGSENGSSENGSGESAASEDSAEGKESKKGDDSPQKSETPAPAKAESSAKASTGSGAKEAA